MKKSILIATILSLALAACGGRAAKPISVTNSYDASLDCASIQREYEANERQVLALIKEADRDNAKNVVFAATGALIFFPALFFMDVGNEEKVEIAALRNRNGVLESLAGHKNCQLPESQLTEVYKRLDEVPQPQESNN